MAAFNKELCKKCQFNGFRARDNQDGDSICNTCYSIWFHQDIPNIKFAKYKYKITKESNSGIKLKGFNKIKGGY